MVELKLGLPDAIIEKTAYIYRKAQQRGVTRGRSVSVLLAATMRVDKWEFQERDDIAVINNIKRKSML